MKDLPLTSPWKQIGTAHGATPWPQYVWEAENANGKLYRVTNNPNPPWTSWGERDLDVLLKRNKLTRDKK